MEREWGGRADLSFIASLFRLSILTQSLEEACTYTLLFPPNAYATALFVDTHTSSSMNTIDRLQIVT